LVYWNPQEYIERRTYRSLKRAWIGFKIAKKELDHDKMKYYAEGIQMFERKLRLPVSNFSVVRDVQDSTNQSGTANDEL
jgi:hypothetical protein